MSILYGFHWLYNPILIGAPSSPHFKNCPSKNWICDLTKQALIRYIFRFSPSSGSGPTVPVGPIGLFWGPVGSIARSRNWRISAKNVVWLQPRLGRAQRGDRPYWWILMGYPGMSIKFSFNWKQVEKRRVMYNNFFPAIFEWSIFWQIDIV